MHLLLDRRFDRPSHEALDLICKNSTYVGVNCLGICSALSHEISSCCLSRLCILGSFFPTMKNTGSLKTHIDVTKKLHTLIGFKTVSVTPGFLQAYYTRRSL